MIKNIEEKETTDNKTYLCCCSAQEFYECGGLGRETCPGSILLEGDVSVPNAVKSNINGCYWVESDHL